jgi:hypothetical protein
MDVGFRAVGAHGLGPRPRGCNRARAGDGHPIVRSAEPGEDWSWCYRDEVAFALAPQHTRRGK